MTITHTLLNNQDGGKYNHHCNRNNTVRQTHCIVRQTGSYGKRNNHEVNWVDLFRKSCPSGISMCFGGDNAADTFLFRLVFTA